MKDLLESIDTDLVPVLEKAQELSLRFGMDTEAAMRLITWYAKSISKSPLDQVEHLLDKFFTEMDKRDEKQRKEQEVRMEREAELFKNYHNTPDPERGQGVPPNNPV